METPSVVLLPKLSNSDHDFVQAGFSRERTPVKVEKKRTNHQSCPSMTKQDTGVPKMREIKLNIGPAKEEANVGVTNMSVAPSKKKLTLADNTRVDGLNNRTKLHLRGQTWPVKKQYQLWMDISSLSLHRFREDERVVRPSSQDPTIKKHTQAANKGNSGKNNGGQRIGTVDYGGRKRKRGSELSLETGGKWRVKQSQVLQTSSNKLLSEKNTLSDARFLPSRMGKNSFKSFLQEATPSSTSVSVHPVVNSSKGPGVISVPSFPEESRSELLRLKGLARLQQIGTTWQQQDNVQKEGKMEESDISSARTKGDKVRKRRQVSFTVPHKRVMDVGQDDNTKDHGGVGGIVAISDIPPPLPPPQFTDTYHITKYITGK